MPQAKYQAKNINGSQVGGAPALGQDLLAIHGSGIPVNLGQVIKAGYEEGHGTGFIVQTTRMDGEAYVKLQDTEGAIPLRW